MTGGTPKVRRVGVVEGAERRTRSNSPRKQDGRNQINDYENVENNFKSDKKKETANIYPSLKDTSEDNPQFQVLLRVPSEEGGGVVNEGYKVDEEPNGTITSSQRTLSSGDIHHGSHPSPRPSPRLSPRLMAENMKRRFSEAIHHKPDNVVFMVGGYVFI